MSKLVERMADLQYRALDRARHREAFKVARRPAQATGFGALRGARQCLVVTFKRSGEAVPTPVNFGLSEDGRSLYFRSEPRSAKVRRIERDPRVLVAPCNLRGKPTGPTAGGRARMVPGSGTADAERAVESNWSAPMGVLERGLDRMPVEIVYVEVRPDP